MEVSGYSYPAVSLERSMFITSVSCNAASKIMTVAFKDHESWSVAAKDWRTHNQFLAITFVDGCGDGPVSAQRSFHLVSRISTSEQNLRIICYMNTIPLEQAIHPEQQFRLHVETYSSPNGDASDDAGAEGAVTVSRVKQRFGKRSESGIAKVSGLV